MSAGPVVTLSRRNDVAWVRWHRPGAANAFDDTLVEEVLGVLEDLAGDPPSVVVLTGEGGRFSAGFDLAGATSDRDLGWRFMRAEELLAVTRSMPSVTVACVQGPAFGLGADLVASCDYRLGDSGARFRFPGPRFGIVLGTHQLLARIGSARATDVLLRNRTVGVEDALQWGLLTHRLEPTEWTGWVADLARDLSDLPSHSRRELLEVLRPDVAVASGAALGRSAHREGLATRVADYRATVLAGAGRG